MSLPTIISGLILAVINTPWVIACLPANRDNPQALRNRATWIVRACWLATLQALLAALLLAQYGETVHTKIAITYGDLSLGIGIYFDHFSAAMLLLVSGLGAAVASFAVRYLDGEPCQKSFFTWLAITLGTTCAIPCVNNLGLLALAWFGTSIGLHYLLTLYQERPDAHIAARNKFWVSRLGDVAMLIALVLIVRDVGALDYESIFASISHGTWNNINTQIVAVLLAIAALTKSAQLPFHSWLPDTLAAPVPVSALMHAGIINAGGFMMIRMGPLLNISPTACALLITVGGLTASMAALVMLTQTDIKRSLAYSTIAQTGFMMLECGLGALATAVLHIIGHACYKAYAFLHSGNAVATGIIRRQVTLSPATPQQIGIGVGAMVTLVTGILLAGQSGIDLPLPLPLLIVFATALCSLVWSAWQQNSRPWFGLSQGLLMSAWLLTIYLASHAVLQWWLADDVVDIHGPNNEPAALIAGLVASVITLSLFILQATLPYLAQFERLRALYVHLYHGFYLSIFAHRLFGKTKFLTTSSSSIVPLPTRWYIHTSQKDNNHV